MKRILVLTVLAAALATTALAGPAGAGLALTDLAVVPNVGHPGDAFAVAGGGCGPTPRGADFSVAVAVAFPSPVATNATPNPDGTWGVAFNVPAGTPPGVYQVSAACLVSFAKKTIGKGVGPDVFPYASATYTVPADPAAPPPAEAVVSTPRLTG